MVMVRSFSWFFWLLCICAHTNSQPHHQCWSHVQAQQEFQVENHPLCYPRKVPATETHNRSLWGICSAGPDELKKDMESVLSVSKIVRQKPLRWLFPWHIRAVIHMFWENTELKATLFFFFFYSTACVKNFFSWLYL